MVSCGLEQGCDSSDYFWGVISSGLMSYTEAQECEFVSLLRASERLGYKMDQEAWYEEYSYRRMDPKHRKSFNRSYRRI